MLHHDRRGAGNEAHAPQFLDVAGQARDLPLQPGVSRRLRQPAPQGRQDLLLEQPDRLRQRQPDAARRDQFLVRRVLDAARWSSNLTAGAQQRRQRPGRPLQRARQPVGTEPSQRRPGVVARGVLAEGAHHDAGQRARGRRRSRLRLEQRAAAAQQQLLKQLLRPQIAGVAGDQLVLIDRYARRQQFLQQRQTGAGAVAGTPVQARRRRAAGAQSVKDAQRQREARSDQPKHVVQVLQTGEAVLVIRHARGEAGFLPFEAANLRAPGPLQTAGGGKLLHPATVRPQPAAVNRRHVGRSAATV